MNGWVEALGAIVYPGLAGASVSFAGLILYEWYYRRLSWLLALAVFLASEAIGFGLVALATGHPALFSREQVVPAARAAFAVALACELYIIVLYVRALRSSIVWDEWDEYEGTN